MRQQQQQSSMMMQQQAPPDYPQQQQVQCFKLSTHQNIFHAANQLSSLRVEYDEPPTSDAAAAAATTRHSVYGGELVELE